MRHSKLIVLLSAVALLAVPARGQCMYEVVYLEEPLCGEPQSSFGRDMNEVMQVAGSLVSCVGDSHACRWLAPGPAEDIHNLFSGLNSIAWGIGPDGDVCGSIDSGSAAFRVAGQSVQMLFGESVGFAAAYDLVGELVVGTALGEDDVYHACSWLGQELTFVGPLQDDFGRVLGMSASGLMTGATGHNIALTERAFIWDGESLITVPPVARGGTSYGAAINCRGDVCGTGFLNADYDGTAFLFADGVMRDLGILPGYESGLALDVNNHRQVVGRSIGQGQRGFLWQKGQLLALSELNESDVITDAWAIDERGRILVRLHPVSPTYSAILVPIDQPAADLDNDCIVDTDDLVRLLRLWGSSGVRADLDGDGIVDVDDLLLLLIEWS